jgi:hypothetical protein
MDSRLCDRWLLGWVTTIVLFILTAPVMAGEFSAETIIDRLGQKQQVTMYVKGRKIRAEMVDTFGQQQILISQPGPNKTFMLYPKTKGYMSFPATAALSPLEQAQGATRRLIGEEKVEGYLCDKYEIAFPNTYRGKLMVWVARKLDYPIRMIQVDGPPGDSLNRKLTHIQERRIDDAMFAVPSDYKQVKKPVQGFCGAGICTVSLY